MTRYNLPRVLTGALTLLSLCFSTATLAADTKEGSELNPAFFYYFNGQTIGYRGFNVSDPDDYGGVNAENFVAESKGKKVSMEPTDYKAKGDAIKVTWARKKKKGGLALNGPAVDLSSYEDLTALAFEVRVDKPPTKDVQLGMDCGWPCRAEVSIARQLRDFNKGEWSLMWMPLNCFKAENFDLSKISGPFLLNSEGKMELSIANIRLERLPEGFKGCAEE